MYHERLLHINKDFIYKTVENTLGLKKIDQGELDDCEACNSGKMYTIIGKKPIASAELLTAFDIDIAGPFKIKGLKGECYFLTITDRGSRAVWIYALKFKADAFNKLVYFCNIISNQFEVKIIELKLDNAKEFKSNK